MRLLLALAMLAAQPARADDVFDRASGIWGLVDDIALTCEVNPHQVTFSADRRRVLFRWSKPMLNYQGQIDLEGEYTVLGHGTDFVVLALDGESRRTRAGAPVVWIMRLRGEGDRYCWGRTDWPPEECIDRYVRCPGSTPVS